MTSNINQDEMRKLQDAAYTAWIDYAADQDLMISNHTQRHAFVFGYCERARSSDATILSQADEIARLRKAARNLIPYLEWTVGPESPGCHPTMPSAVGTFMDAFPRATVPSTSTSDEEVVCPCCGAPCCEPPRSGETIRGLGLVCSLCGAPTSIEAALSPPHADREVQND